jgi:hypothetical protein
MAIVAAMPVIAIMQCIIAGGAIMGMLAAASAAGPSGWVEAARCRLPGYSQPHDAPESPPKPARAPDHRFRKGPSQDEGDGKSLQKRCPAMTTDVRDVSLSWDSGMPMRGEQEAKLLRRDSEAAGC